jgi:crossover junction endodeoxyribonuclease RuvC
LTVYFGVDPGKSGAVAAIGDGTAVILDMPLVGDRLDLGKIGTWMLHSQTAGVALERQQAFPKQGGVSNFTIGFNYGQLMAMLQIHGIPFDTVRPAEWKRALGIPAGADKMASIQRALDLFPGADLRGPRGGWRDGRAEALLLAEWRRRRG